MLFSHQHAPVANAMVVTSMVTAMQKSIHAADGVWYSAHLPPHQIGNDDPCIYPKPRRRRQNEGFPVEEETRYDNTRANEAVNLITSCEWMSEAVNGARRIKGAVPFL